MYPNLYYVFRDWFGVEWHGLSLLNTFGLLVAISFAISAYVLNLELQRKEKQGLLHPREENIIVGKGASLSDLLMNFMVGFLFGYKILGALIDRLPDVTPQEYMFSREGNIFGGLVIGLLMAGLKWRDKEKQKLKDPETRTVRIWPHDRIGDIVVLAMIFGIVGAKLFDNIENWDDFVKDPIGRFFSASGLTFYGGLIMATVAIIYYAKKKGIKISHLVDAAAPALMLAYAIGRVGCQVSGDGDWGFYNSAYSIDAYGHVIPADPDGFRSRLVKDSIYYLDGKVMDPDSSIHYVTDRTYPSLDSVPHGTFKGTILPSWFFAYAYPGNVNKDGIRIKDNVQEHNRMLPQPVYPTPLYETILCLAFFFIMWASRKRIKIPLLMFGLYLALNGVERFFMERIRVNRLYEVGSFHISQASVIALLLLVSGVLLMLYAVRRNRILTV